MKSFKERLQSEIIVFDGGTGTYLYEKGIYINRCFEELNLTNPELVIELHRDYVNAGADVIETNTFGANKFALAPHGLESKVYEINYKGAKLAKSVAKDSALVAGSVGPLRVQIEPLGKLSFEEARDAFAEQIKGLLDGGVDLIVFETFSLIEELIQGVRAVRELHADIPILAQVTINSEGNLLSGESLQRFVEGLSPYHVDAIGLNCSEGPRLMLEALERLRELTTLPLSVQPNAGLPQNIGGRNLYMTSPEYMAEYAKRFIQTGASIVGGCCGTNPTHIKAIRRAVQALQPAKRMDVKVETLKIEKPEQVRVYQKEEKSRLSKKLVCSEFVKLVELVSPKGISAEKEIAKAK
ncbi:MAG: homocysteine S-methyltransferase family protein, partial [Bacteroidota bacterium]